MPTQQEIEFYRLKYQQLTYFKLKAAWFIALVSNISTAPLEFLKVRAQLLQEGRRLHGFGTERGAPTVRLINEIVDSGHGLKSLFTGLDSLIARSFWYGGIRAYSWSIFYGFYNQDPRRQPHFANFTIAGFLGGFFAGIAANPVDLVYNRQVADGLLPEGFKRNYSSFINGLIRANHEKVLFRGGLASGLALGGLGGSMSNVYDFLKEWIYFIFGPVNWLRPFCLLPTALAGALFYLPFDNIRTRLHTMRSLPNGELPYKGTVDALNKISKYECSLKFYNSFGAFYSGFLPTFIRLYVNLNIGCYISDLVFQKNYMEGEGWQSATWNHGPTVIEIPHDPINMGTYNAKKVLNQTRPNRHYSLDKFNENSYVEV